MINIFLLLNNVEFKTNKTNKGKIKQKKINGLIKNLNKMH